MQIYERAEAIDCLFNNKYNFIFQFVADISKEFSDDTIEYIKKLKKEKPEKKPTLWGEHIHYRCVPYIPIKKFLPKMISKPAIDSNFIRDFSMKYNDKANMIETVFRPKSKVSSIIYLFSLYPRILCDVSSTNIWIPILFIRTTYFFIILGNQ